MYFASFTVTSCIATRGEARPPKRTYKAQLKTFHTSWMSLPRTSVHCWLN